MRIKLLTHLAGPDLTATAGQEIEVDDATATALLDGGFATAVKVEAEAATLAAPEDTTATKRSGRRRAK